PPQRELHPRLDLPFPRLDPPPQGEPEQMVEAVVEQGQSAVGNAGGHVDQSRQAQAPKDGRGVLGEIQVTVVEGEHAEVSLSSPSPGQRLQRLVERHDLVVFAQPRELPLEGFGTGEQAGYHPPNHAVEVRHHPMPGEDLHAATSRAPPIALRDPPPRSASVQSDGGSLLDRPARRPDQLAPGLVPSFHTSPPARARRALSSRLTWSIALFRSRERAQLRAWRWAASAPRSKSAPALLA